MHFFVFALPQLGNCLARLKLIIHKFGQTKSGSKYVVMLAEDSFEVLCQIKKTKGQLEATKCEKCAS